MQVWVAVNEADIGNVQAGTAGDLHGAMRSRMKRSAGSRQVRLNATMTQNVVVSCVEDLTDNSSGRLLPYLTANVKFEVARRDDVLIVPNAALHWAHHRRK